ncbi:thioredoxin family protein [Thalassomonas actiniarum]|uniref:Thioredoxin family protein n=1 Tax=Thalassomonas actiniarum TaxID=485447 RepID=A0AAE9YV20_9GAMM|nr:thioredoxin family protein [Thalassomonas actiniarum]WDE00167.1 thioredoxin family protein [Thalassomonas actiniarum]
MKIFRTITLSALLLFTLVACAHDGKVAVGAINTDELLAQYADFSQAYRQVELSEQELAQVKRWPDKLEVTTYFGTWCHDSQREVPKMLKILALRPELSSQLIALDINKSEPEGRASDAGIAFTPTFVITLDGRELGRIVERPETSLVADISAFLAG